MVVVRSANYPKRDAHDRTIAELAIAREAAEVGVGVLKPLTDGERYDLVRGAASASAVPKQSAPRRELG
jgi:hypothetical protein